MMTYIKTSLLGILILLCTSCINLSKQHTQARYFQLPESTQTSLSPSEKPNLTIGITRIEIASYLQKKKIAFRKSPTEIRYHQYDYWAEPLTKSIQRHCRNQLSQLLPSCIIVSTPWDLPQKPHYLLSLRIDQFESAPNQKGTVSGNWILLDNIKDEIIQQKSFKREIRIDGTDTNQEIEALSGQLDAVLQEIADCFMSH